MTTIGSKPGNVIVPVTNFTKSTKWLDVSSYMSSNLGSFSTSGSSKKYAKAKFHADSAGQWYMDLHFTVTHDMSSGGLFYLAGTHLKNGIVQGTAGMLVNASPYVGSIYFDGESDGNRICTYSSSDRNETRCMVDGILLESEPVWSSLGTSASAVMENVVGMDAYIPFGQTGVPGEIIYGTLPNTTAITAGDTDFVCGTLSLTKGTWLIMAKGVANTNSGVLYLSISTDAASHAQSQVNAYEIGNYPTASTNRPLTTAGQNVYIVCREAYWVNTRTFYGSQSQFYAVRLAP